jgi:thiol-disulfide isomerase/thioredoxin
VSPVEVVSELLQWLVLLALGALLTGLVYLVADINRRLGPDYGPLVPNDGLEIGDAVPDLNATDLRSTEFVDLSKRVSRTAVVVFVSPTCQPCASLVPHLNRLARSRRDVSFFAVVLEGSGFDYSAALHDSIALVSDEGGGLSRVWQVERTPLTYVVDAEGLIAMRSIANDFIDLEDALAGYGRPQGSLQWIPQQPETGA